LQFRRFLKLPPPRFAGQGKGRQREGAGSALTIRRPPLDCSQGVQENCVQNRIVPANEQSAGQFNRYWQAVSSEVGRVDARPRNLREFSYLIHAQALGPLQFVDIESDAVVLNRSAHCIARDPRNHYIVSLHRTGRGTIRHHRAEVAMAPGTVVLIDKALPYETTFHDTCARLLICIPRVMLERRLNDPDRFLRVQVSADKGIGRIAMAYADSLLQEAARLDPVNQAEAAAVCVDLLAAAFMAVPEDDHAQRESFNVDLRRGGGLALLSRMRAYIRSNLSRPDLDPKSIADAHGISKRYLHALFAPTGTSVGAFIRDERLDRTYRDLGNPRLRDLSVTQIVMRNGFNDVPHFTRRFKEKYGVQPNTLRAARRGEPSHVGDHRELLPKRCQPARK
jgi:AraC-like DNA-binding protein